MRRRRVLAAFAACLGGCLSRPGAGTDTPARSPESDSTPGTRTSVTESVGGTTGTPDRMTGTSGPSSSTSVGSDSPDGCPSHSDADRVICAGGASPTEAPVSLVADPTAASLPTATFEFTLTNAGDRRFMTNFYDWAVRKYVDGRWYRIAPRLVPLPLMTLDPGEGHTWQLSVDNTRPDEASGGLEATDEIRIAGLGGGEYAFTTAGWFEDEGHEQQTGLAARFTLSGGPIELVPTDEVTETVREGDTVVVHTNVDPEAGRPAAFVLERTDEQPDRRLIAERAFRDRKLRNTLPYFEAGIETVRLEEPTTTMPPFGVQEPYVIGYRGASFRVRAEER